MAVKEPKENGAWKNVQAELKAIGSIVKQHDKVLLGNGQAGLIQTVARLEGAMNGITQNVSKMGDSVRRMELSAVRLEGHTTAIGKSVDSIKEQVDKFEKKLKPIIDWKKGIIIRLSTMGGTALFIIGAIWWLYEHWDKIKEAFK